MTNGGIHKKQLQDQSFSETANLQIFHGGGFSASILIPYWN